MRGNGMREFISLTEILKHWSEHSPNSKWYQKMKEDLRLEIEKATNTSHTEITLEGIEQIILPFYTMGNVTSLDLFGLDELILFTLYKKRKERGMAIDLGANIGLHSIVLSKLGYEVLSVEPDPIHVKQMLANFQTNKLENIQVIEKAVSTKSGIAEFVRVEGNTTGSHLAGSRGKQPYGGTHTFQVETVAISELLSSNPNTTLVKMDVEGFEAELICSLDSDYYTNIDFVLEVGSHDGALLIFEYLQLRGLHARAQKIGWEKVNKLADMPHSYKEGSLIIPMQNST